MQMPDESNPEIQQVPPADKLKWTPPALKKSEVAGQTANSAGLQFDGLASSSQ